VTPLERTFSPESKEPGITSTNMPGKFYTKFGKEAAKFTGIQIKNFINIPIMKACHNCESKQRNHYIKYHFLTKIPNCFVYHQAVVYETKTAREVYVSS
jgi:hypothetical protein